ncbi:hypothetical protein WJX72_010964 [[Myrmecia] bisecta]|uniref:NAD-dependent epimerase/dehydratase domain-containing protein n=1 Tax=[Myrmecia] bisecta TaxID=41462 RepID=A0AAW1PYR9_9CHLO
MKVFMTDNMKARGVKPVFGDLNSLDAFAQAARHADAVLHLAFIHDFTDYEGSCATETRVLDAINGALAGTGKTFVVTSGTAVVGDSGSTQATESASTMGARAESSEAGALKGVEQGVRAIVLRLPLYVYDESFFCSGFVSIQVQAAQQARAASYIGSGQQQFSVVHVDDAAAAYLAALRHGPAGGIYNIAGEKGVTTKQLATAVAQRLSTADFSMPVRGISQEEAAGLYPGMLGHVFAMNNDVDTSKAKRELQWEAKHTGGFVAAVANAKQA